MILILISFFLDSVLSNYFPYTSPYLSWFQPCLFVVSIVTLFYFVKNEKKFLRQGILFTILGSLIFGNSLFLRLLSFLLIYLFLKKIKKKYRNGTGIYSLSLIISLVIHYFSYYIIILLAKDSNITLSLLGNQIIHSILLNLLIGILFYLFLGIKKLVH